jgi:hypothetical protein
VRAGDVALGRRALELGDREDVLALQGGRASPGLLGEGELRLGLGNARALLVVAEAEEEHPRLHLLAFGELDGVDDAGALGPDDDRFVRVELPDQVELVDDRLGRERHRLDDHRRRAGRLAGASRVLAACRAEDDRKDGEQAGHGHGRELTGLPQLVLGCPPAWHVR